RAFLRTRQCENKQGRRDGVSPSEGPFLASRSRASAAVSKSRSSPDRGRHELATELDGSQQERQVAGGARGQKLLGEHVAREGDDVGPPVVWRGGRSETGNSREQERRRQRAPTPRQRTPGRGPRGGEGRRRRETATMDGAGVETRADVRKAQRGAARRAARVVRINSDPFSLSPLYLTHSRTLHAQTLARPLDFDREYKRFTPRPPSTKDLTAAPSPPSVFNERIQSFGMTIEYLARKFNRFADIISRRRLSPREWSPADSASITISGGALLVAVAVAGRHSPRRGRGVRRGRHGSAALGGPTVLLAAAVVVQRGRYAAAVAHGSGALGGAPVFLAVVVGAAADDASVPPWAARPPRQHRDCRGRRGRSREGDCVPSGLIPSLFSGFRASVLFSFGWRSRSTLNQEGYGTRDDTRQGKQEPRGKPFATARGKYGKNVPLRNETMYDVDALKINTLIRWALFDRWLRWEF
ncbi:MAG: hypothetical protein BJ554DRAFT_890, partial [Olpidium bornovanus]